MTTTPAGSAETNLPQTGPSAFDDHHPPQRELLDDCVHCGFCLPTCPTYQLWGEEMDSPRGRIYLINLAEKGEIGLDGPLHEHIDRCLGCMACVTACPSGRAVRPAAGGRAPAARAQRRRAPATTGCSAKRSSRCSPTSGGCGRPPCPARLYQKLRALPVVRGSPQTAAGHGSARWSRCCRRSRCATPSPALPERIPATGGRGGPTVALLTGCVQDVFFHRVNAATVRVLAAEGCDVVVPRDQQCCGALELHAGREERRAGPGPEDDRPVRAARRGPRRRQRRGLRVVDEGLRPPARRRPRVGGAGRGVQRVGPRRPRGARRPARRRPARPAAPGPRPRGLPRRLPPRARAGRARPAPRGAALDPGAGGRRHPRGRAVLRLGGDLQHGGAGAGRRAGRAQGGEHPLGAAGHRRHRRTPGACCRSAST